MTGTLHPDFTIYRCRECGKVDLCEGSLHAHIEVKHRGWGPLNIFPRLRRNDGYYRSLIESTDVIEITDYTVQKTTPDGVTEHN